MDKNLINKAKKIRVIITDVDGVLTDGGIIYDNNYLEYKRYNVKDGQIISHLKKFGFIVGAITGRESKVVKKRLEELKFNFAFHGVKDKLEKYEQIKKQFKLKDEEIAFIGDDIIDLPILVRCGLSAAPNDSRNYIKQEVDFVTSSNGGEGVFRDVADLILEYQNLMNKLLEQMKR